jgi:hypothetical protein
MTSLICPPCKAGDGIAGLRFPRRYHRRLYTVALQNPQPGPDVLRLAWQKLTNNPTPICLATNARQNYCGEVDRRRMGVSHLLLFPLD